MHFVLLSNTFLQQFDGSGVGIFALQEPAITPQRFTARITGYALKGGIDVDHGEIAALGSDNNHPVGA